MRQYGPIYLGQNGETRGVVRSDSFIFASFMCINNSPDWVYFMAAAEGSTSVEANRWGTMFPPFTQGVIPSGGFSLAWLRTSEQGFDIDVTVSQPADAERVAVILFDVVQSSPIVGLPGTTIAAQLVAGDLTVDTLWWHIAAAGGALPPDTDIKLLLTPNAANERGLVIRAAAAQTDHLFEIQDSTGAVLAYISAAGTQLNMDNGGTVPVLNLTPNSVSGMGYGLHILPDSNTSDAHAIMVEADGAGGADRIGIRRLNDAKSVALRLINAAFNGGWDIQFTGSQTYLDFQAIGVGNPLRLETTGRFSRYANLTTEGLGVPAILDVNRLTGQSANIAAQNITNANVAGQYRVSMFLVTTTVGNAVTVNGQLNWTDGSGARTLQIGNAIAINALGNNNATNPNANSVVVDSTGVQMTWQTNQSGALGLGRYTVVVITERLN